jgi:hypothetical protein
MNINPSKFNPMNKHTVFIFSNQEIKIHEFSNPMEAVRFYYLTKMNPAQQSHISLMPIDLEFNDFFPPKVISFNGTFVNEYFVGNLKLEGSDGDIATLEGVIPVSEVDFGKYSLKQDASAQQAIIGLKIAGAREIGRNEHTCQTFFVIADHMLAVDDMGLIKVSKPLSTWNESIDEVLYTYENPYQYENDQYEGF